MFRPISYSYRFAWDVWFSIFRVCRAFLESVTVDARKTRTVTIGGLISGIRNGRAAFETAAGEFSVLYLITQSQQVDSVLHAGR